jgi:hypothetical protein
MFPKMLMRKWNVTRDSSVTTGSSKRVPMGRGIAEL